jgi:antitoxin VapB
MSVTNTRQQASTGSTAAAAPKTAKLFMNGRSQAVRLPKEFRFEGNEVIIRRNPSTGEVLLSPKAEMQKKPWEELFASWDALGSPEEGALERDQNPPIERDFF